MEYGSFDSGEDVEHNRLSLKEKPTTFAMNVLDGLEPFEIV